MKAKIVSKESTLQCPKCRNRDYFVETMEEEEHLVDSNRNYIRLLHAKVHSYTCYICGSKLDFND